MVLQQIIYHSIQEKLRQEDPMIDTPTIKQDQQQRKKQLKAYTFQFLSAITLVLMQLNVKQLSLHFSPFLALGIRGSLLFLLSTWLIDKNKLTFNVKSSETFFLVMKRSIISSFVVSLYLGSLPYLPMGVANTLFNTGPIMTIFIEAYLLKKSTIHPLHLMLTLISFTGVILIIQPQFIFASSQTDGQIFYYFVVLLAALLSSFSIIFLHQLGGKCNELVALQYGYITQGLGSYFFYIFSHNDQEKSISFLQSIDLFESVKILICTLLMVVFSFLTQYFRAKSVYLCSPALVQPFAYCTVILGILLDTIFFQASYDFLKALGVLMASLGLFSKLIIVKCSKSIYGSEIYTVICVNNTMRRITSKERLRLWKK